MAFVQSSLFFLICFARRLIMVTLAVLAFLLSDGVLQATLFVLFILFGLSDELKSNGRERGGIGFALVPDYP